MDGYVFHCNNIECRAELTQQAIVTTCQHIYCIDWYVRLCSGPADRPF